MSDEEGVSKDSDEGSSPQEVLIRYPYEGHAVVSPVSFDVSARYAQTSQIRLRNAATGVIIGTYTTNPAGRLYIDLPLPLGPAVCDASSSQPNGSWTPWAGRTNFVVVEKATLISPAPGTVITPRQIFTGRQTSDRRVSARIDVPLNDSYEETLRPTPDTWSFQPKDELPLGEVKLAVNYHVPFYNVGNNPVIHTFICEETYVAPTITQPTEGQVVKAAALSVTGGGTRGKTIELRYPGGLPLHGTAQVGRDNQWTAKFNLGNYPFGGEVKMGAAHLDQGDWSALRTFFLAVAPVINRPNINEPVDVKPTISGTGTMGADIEVFQDLDHSFIVGRSSVGPNGRWEITNFLRELIPGPFAIIARQTYRGDVSLSSARHFKVRPPAFTGVDVNFPTPNTIRFSGSGYYKVGIRTEVEIRFDVAAPVDLPPRVSVDANGRWLTTATGWPPGDYSLIAVQMVEDRDKGWIESTPLAFPVKKGLPDVTDVTHTQDYQPTFSGKGVSGALVYVVKNGGVQEAPEALVGPTGSWRTEASHVWGPTKDRPVYIQQRKDGLTSEDWFEYKVTIAPLPPEINTPPADGLTPEFTGTCWQNSLVTLSFNDNAKEYAVQGVNSIWKFRRPEAFSSGVTYTIFAKQTAGGQTSELKSLQFKVRRQMSKPEITEPAEDAEVGHVIIVRGRDGMAGATLQLRDANNKKPLGEAMPLSSDGDWTIALKDLDFERYGSYSIEAIQTIESDTSSSDVRKFTVAVLPPVIEVPAANQSLTRTSTISGKGRPEASVELKVDDQRFTDIHVDSAGCWSCEVKLAVGEKTLSAQVIFNGTRSRESTVQYNVVPAAPFIETPALGEHVGRHAVVSGFGIPGDSVAVRLGNAQGRVLGESPVLPDRTWSVAVEFDQPGGRFGVVAVASCDGFSSADSEARTVNLGTFAPTIEQPASGRWVVNPVRFNGKGRPGSATLVSWFNPDQVWASALPVNGSGWQGEANAPLSRGGQWVRLQQTISDEADGATHSDCVDSRRFEMLPPEPEG